MMKRLLLLAPFLLLSAFSEAASSSPNTGFVYVMSNRAQGNSIIQYSRSDTGALERIGEVSTGGLGGAGNGVGALDPLGSQDALVLTNAGALLLAVNAGSNQISSLRVGAAGMGVVSLVSSNGEFPNSVAVRDDLVYVLNAHTPSIAGFRLDSSGALTAIPGAVFAVPGGAAAKPHDIRFSPDGTRLVVSVDGLNAIDVVALGSDGLVASITADAAAGKGPFALRFGRGGVLVNAEAASASASSYQLNADNTLSVLTAAVPTTQTATCWISLTGDGKFGFSSNTGSGTLSAYHLSGNGTLNLESVQAGSLDGGAPIDSALSSDSAFLYVIDSAFGRVFAFAVHGASLIPINSVQEATSTLQGIAAQ